MGHNKLNKLIKYETRYIEKNTFKHKHDFSIKCILEVNMLDNKKYYYNVLKCSKCNSFVSIREPGNVQGRLFVYNDNKEHLPVLEAEVNKRNLIIPFSYIQNVKLKE